MPALPRHRLLIPLAITALLAAAAGVSLGLRIGKNPDQDLARDSLIGLQALLPLPPLDHPGFAQALQQLRHTRSQQLLMAYRHADPTQRRQIAQALGHANAQGWYSTADFSRLQATLACMEERPGQPLPQCLAQQLQPISEGHTATTTAP